MFPFLKLDMNTAASTSLEHDSREASFIAEFQISANMRN